MTERQTDYQLEKCGIMGPPFERGSNKKLVKQGTMYTFFTQLGDFQIFFHSKS